MNARMKFGLKPSTDMTQYLENLVTYVTYLKKDMSSFHNLYNFAKSNLFVPFEL